MGWQGVPKRSRVEVGGRRPSRSFIVLSSALASLLSLAVAFGSALGESLLDIVYSSTTPADDSPEERGGTSGHDDIAAEALGEASTAAAAEKPAPSEFDSVAPKVPEVTDAANEQRTELSTSVAATQVWRPILPTATSTQVPTTKAKAPQSAEAPRTSAAPTAVPSFNPAVPPQRKAMMSDVCNPKTFMAVRNKWCPGFQNCFTQFERDYMKKHAEALQVGLGKIRGEGCFPHGSVIASAGYYRSGSTVLYNVARLWAVLGAGDRLLSGWKCPPLTKAGPGGLGSELVGCTVVCKDHVLGERVGEYVDVVLMSRRDPWESVCSRKIQGLWCNWRVEWASKGDSKDPKKHVRHAFSQQCVNNQTMQAFEAQLQCRDLMKMQADIYYRRKQMGAIVNFDALMSDYDTSPDLQVQEIAKGMGVCNEAAEDTELVKLVLAMIDELKKHSGHDQELTMVHDIHSDRERELQCTGLREQMYLDRDCREWSEHNASAEFNAIYKAMVSGKR